MLNMHSDVVRNKRDGFVDLGDLTGANRYGEFCPAGDFAWNVPGVSILQPLARGKLKRPRQQDEQPMTGGWSELLTDIGAVGPDANYATLPDLAEQRAGSYAMDTFQGTHGNKSKVFALDLSYIMDGAKFGEADKSLLFPDTEIRGAGAEGDPTNYTVTWRSPHVSPTLT